MNFRNTAILFFYPSQEINECKSSFSTVPFKRGEPNPTNIQTNPRPSSLKSKAFSLNP